MILETMRAARAPRSRSMLGEHVLDADASKAPRGFLGVDLDADLAQAVARRRARTDIRNRPEPRRNRRSGEAWRHDRCELSPVRPGVAGIVDRGGSSRPGESEFPKGHSRATPPCIKAHWKAIDLRAAQFELRLDLVEALRQQAEPGCARRSGRAGSPRSRGSRPRPRRRAPRAWPRPRPGRSSARRPSAGA